MPRTAYTIVRDTLCNGTSVAWGESEGAGPTLPVSFPTLREAMQAWAQDKIDEATMLLERATSAPDDELDALFEDFELDQTWIVKATIEDDGTIRDEDGRKIDNPYAG